MVDSDSDTTGAAPGAGRSGPPEPIPLGQRVLDNWLLLLVACIVVMFVFYTGWGVVEMMTLTEAPLP